MKNVLIYPRAESARSSDMFFSLMREGRRRNWRFLSVSRIIDPGESDRLAALRSELNVSGWVGYHVGAAITKALSGLPTVFVNSGNVPAGVPVVRHDNAAFGVAAADALGFASENYAVVRFSDGIWPKTREAAFAARLAENGRKCTTIGVSARNDRPFSAFRELRDAMSRLPIPVSVFAVNDRLADAVLAAAESLGLRCPRDIRVVGCDDDELVCMASPVTLSSVRPDWDAAGRLIADALEVQMRGGTPRSEYVYGASGVVRRASTRNPYRRPLDDRVERAIAFIDAEYAEKIRVEDVLRAMGGSRRHGERRFREETGKSILETIEDRRMERLLSHLGCENPDLGRLPALCGFRSAASLRDFFRRRTGMSMTAWRRRQSAMAQT